MGAENDGNGGRRRSRAAFAWPLAAASCGRLQAAVGDDLGRLRLAKALTPVAGGNLRHGGPAAGAVAGEGACARVASTVAMAASASRWPDCLWTASAGHAGRWLPLSILSALPIWSCHGGGARGLVGVCRSVVVVLRDAPGLFRWRCCVDDGEWASTMNTSGRHEWCIRAKASTG
jgi:hypothetical protein